VNPAFPAAAKTGRQNKLSSVRQTDGTNRRPLIVHARLGEFTKLIIVSPSTGTVELREAQKALSGHAGPRRYVVSTPRPAFFCRWLYLLEYNWNGKGRSATHALMRGEARRIAANIAGGCPSC
jgi:hypothetical protein